MTQISIQPQLPHWVKADISVQVSHALEEDIGSGDITAELIPADANAHATLITREDMVLCGQAWVEEILHQLGGNLTIKWHHQDGDLIKANDPIFELSGRARTILTAERPALNFLQTLSGTATITRYYADLIAGTGATLLDTRKTIPGLRTAQKYAVTCGGGKNHRIGLYDAFLLKENHIEAHGSITEAVKLAKQLYPNRWIEVETETMEQVQEAMNTECDVIMLDNFSYADMATAAKLVNGRVKLEASGDITADNIAQVAKTGVDYISIGALTKHVRAVDLSLRLSL